VLKIFSNLLKAISYRLSAVSG